MEYNESIIKAMVYIVVITVAINWFLTATLIRFCYFRKLYYNKYQRKDLFSPKEAELFPLLKEELYKMYWDKYHLLSHVRMKDIFEVIEEKDWKETINIWARWHVDFLVIDNKTLEPKLAIELNWLSHYSPNQILTDNFKKKLFRKNSNIKLAYMWNSELWKWEKTIEKIRQNLKLIESKKELNT